MVHRPIRADWQVVVRSRCYSTFQDRVLVLSCCVRILVVGIVVPVRRLRLSHRVCFVRSGHDRWGVGMRVQRCIISLQYFLHDWPEEHKR